MEQQQDTLSNLSTYITLAKKTIAKFSPKFYNGLSTEMLKNEEAISDVATAIMYADWRFDPNRVGKSGQHKTLYSYRNQCAIWAIKTYMTSKYKKKKHVSLGPMIGSARSKTNRGTYTQNSENNPLEFQDKSQESPLDILIETEYTKDLADLTEQILSSKILSDKQQQQIRMYFFEDKTLACIGKYFNVSREAVRQNIKRGLDIIKTYDHS